MFAYAAASTLVDPALYRSYIPRSFRQGPMTDVLLRAFAVYELGLTAALLLPGFRRRACLLAAVTLLAIVAVNADSFDVLFRNVAIAFSALALASMSSGPPRSYDPLKDTLPAPDSVSPPARVFLGTREVAAPLDPSALNV